LKTFAGIVTVQTLKEVPLKLIFIEDVPIRVPLYLYISLMCGILNDDKVTIPQVMHILRRQTHTECGDTCQSGRDTCRVGSLQQVLFLNR
jgi:hypothetical protein